MSPDTEASPPSLPGPGALLQEAASLYGARIVPWVLLAVLGGSLWLLLSAACFAPLYYLYPSLQENPKDFFTTGGGLVAAWMLGTAWVSGWIYTAFLITAVDPSAALGDALSRARPRALGAVWVGLLRGFLVVGGFCLFLLPGFLF